MPNMTDIHNWIDNPLHREFIYRSYMASFPGVPLVSGKPENISTADWHQWWEEVADGIGVLPGANGRHRPSGQATLQQFYYGFKVATPITKARMWKIIRDNRNSALAVGWPRAEIDEIEAAESRRTIEALESTTRNASTHNVISNKLMDEVIGSVTI